MTEQNKYDEAKEQYSKNDFFAVIYLKGGCSNGNEKISLTDSSAWMYYIEITAPDSKTADKCYEDHFKYKESAYSQNSMTLEAMWQAMNKLCELGINDRQLLFITDYQVLAKGINNWSYNWTDNNFVRKDGSVIEDSGKWQDIIDNFFEKFRNSQIYYLSKKDLKEYPEFEEGMKKVTDFVNSETEQIN